MNHSRKPGIVRIVKEINHELIDVSEADTLTIDILTASNCKTGIVELCID